MKCSKETQNNSADCGSETIEIKEHPHMEEAELYWKSLRKKVQHNEKAEWIRRERKN
jgi:hypothetical protein